MGRRRRGQKAGSGAPLDRFAWKDGDVIIRYDPSKDPNAKTDAQKDAEDRARGVVLEGDQRGYTPQRHSPPGPGEEDEPVRFTRRRR